MVLSRRLSLLTSIALLPLAACGDAEVGAKVLKSVHVGMSIDSVAKIVGDGPLTATTPTDSARLYHGFRTQQFFSSGRALFVLWYREAPGSLEEGILRTRESPVLFDSDTVIAVGWDDYTQWATEYRIPDPTMDLPRPQP